MPWVPLVLLAAISVAARFVLARLAGCLLWVVLAALAVTLLLALGAHTGHAASDSGPSVVWAELVAPKLELPVATSARGLVLSAKSELPAHPRPLGTRVLLAGDPQGQAPIWADDLLRVRYVDATGRERVLEHDFRSADGQTIEPWRPVDVTDLFSYGPFPLLIEVVDLAPPNAGLGSLWLVALAPAAPSTVTPSLPVTRAPTQTATRTVVVTQATPTSSPTPSPMSTPTPSPTVGPPAGQAGTPSDGRLVGGVALGGVAVAGLGVILRSSVMGLLERLAWMFPGSR